MRVVRERLFDQDPYRDLPLMPVRQIAFNTPASVLDLAVTRQAQRVIEVGSWTGNSVLYMADRARDAGLATEFLCIDTWLGAFEFWAGDWRQEPAMRADRYDALELRNGYPTVYYQFLSNVVQAGHQDRVTPFPQTSQIAARILAHWEVFADFLYIDASHDHADVLSDLRAYWPLLSPGGVMCGDDHNDCFGVATALAEFVKDLGLSAQVYPDFGWSLEKPLP